MVRHVYFYCVLAGVMMAGSLCHAKTLFHWTFDGPAGGALTQTSDPIAGAALHATTSSGGIGSIIYGKANPWFNSKGTSAEFDGDRTWGQNGTGLAVRDDGVDSAIDLSGQPEFTIELFFCPFSLEDSVLFGKCTYQGQYAIEIAGRGLRFYINGQQNSVVTAPGMVQLYRWHHLAAVLSSRGGSQPMKLYLDGVLVASGGAMQAVKDSPDTLGVGGRVDWPSDWPQPGEADKSFVGRIDELRVSDRALEPAEFLLNMVTTKARCPYPQDGAEQFSRTTHLKWQPAKGVTSQRIYFGTNPAALPLLQEVGPEVSLISNLDLGGRLAQETAYYWRVDSQGPPDTNKVPSYSYDDEGRGETWTFATQDQKVQPGYLKWLLHLGQRREDRVLSPYITYNLLGTAGFGGDANIRPRPGEIFDFHGGTASGWVDAEPIVMIWTPHYSNTGFFWHEPKPTRDGYSHDYCIYVTSPDERQARILFRATGEVCIWNNGRMVFNKPVDLLRENAADLVLQQGANAMLFAAGTSANYPGSVGYLAVRVTDPNGNDFTDLTYSLEPPLPPAKVHVTRQLPPSYRAGSSVEVSLQVDCNNAGSLGEFKVTETIPDGLSVVDVGNGEVIDNTIWWTLRANEAASIDLHYRLGVPTNYRGVIPFIGYVYRDANLDEIAGDAVLFGEPPVSPADMIDQLETVEIDLYKCVDSNHVTLGRWDHVDGEGSLLTPSPLLSGLKPYKEGGWAEYAFSVEHGGLYHVMLDYGELWTMFHHTAAADIVIDGTTTLHVDLFPTTHSYQPYGHSNIEAERPWVDPERKAKWIVGDVHLNPGEHTLRLEFPAFCGPDMKLDWHNDGRPVIAGITLTNHPGLTVPRIAEPHHLDSYEHAPACLVHDRDVGVLPDGRVEMTIHGTFYSLSQGNEIYFADGSFQPRPGSDHAKFEIVSIEPEVFHLPSEGEQDFALIVRSTEPVSAEYSEMAVVWLQGVPSAPSRKPYLFTTARTYIKLPTIAQEWAPGTTGGIFPGIGNFMSLGTMPTITDDAEALIPDRYDLGFERGRYKLDIGQFFQQQLQDHRLPSMEQAWPTMEQWRGSQSPTMGQIWSQIVVTPYETLDLKQGEAFIHRLAETLVFCPVALRWDWARPAYLPAFDILDYFMRNVPALTPHIRCAQEGLVDDTEQFKILHNLVLPVFTSFWDQLRVQAVLIQDANEGDTSIVIDRPLYGKTGSSTNGFSSRYLLIDGDPYRPRWPEDEHRMGIVQPLRKSYPKGTLVTSWSFAEDIELEAIDLNCLLWVAGASRDEAVVDQILSMTGEILNKQKIFWPDGSFRNEPGSYGHDSWQYPNSLVSFRRLYDDRAVEVISSEALDKMRGYLITTCRFAFSNGKTPMLNGGGGLNQLDRSYCGNQHLLYMLETLFPEEQAVIERYRRVFAQEESRVPRDIIDNENFVVHGYGYAMLRSENRVWDRRMETLLSSKHLLQDPGDHVSRDGLSIVVYGLGGILTPRYGYSWVGYLPPFLNQVMIDEKWRNNENGYYGSFWHFDGREELPSAVAHVGDGNDCSTLDQDMSRWCIQFPEYLFDAYFVQAKDPNVHQYDWSLINMGEMKIVEPQSLAWEPCPQFLDGYWPAPGTRGGGPRSVAAKGPGRIVVDWHVSNRPWVDNDDSTLLRFTPAHSGRLRLIAADDTLSNVIDAQIGYWYDFDPFQSNSQDILVIRKLAASHAFVDTLEPIADDEQPYVNDVTVVTRGNHQQQLIKVTTAEGEDWVFLSGHWGARPDGDRPLVGVTTDADIVAWRTEGGFVTRFYLANGSYATTPDGHWQFEYVGNHYLNSRN